MAGAYRVLFKWASFPASPTSHVIFIDSTSRRLRRPLSCHTDRHGQWRDIITYRQLISWTRRLLASSRHPLLVMSPPPYLLGVQMTLASNHLKVRWSPVLPHSFLFLFRYFRCILFSFLHTVELLAYKDRVT